MKPVKEILTPDPVTIGPKASIRKALEIKRKGGFRRLPVVEDGQLVGIVSDRDLREAVHTPMVKHLKKYDDYILDHAKVDHCMTMKPITLSPHDSLETAAKLMRDRKVGGIPVLEDGQLVGIITESDLLNYLIPCLKAEEMSTQMLQGLFKSVTRIC